MRTQSAENALAEEILNQLDQLTQEIQVLVYPYAVRRERLPPDVQKRVDDLRAQADAAAGGNAVEFLRATVLQLEEEAARIDAQDGIQRDNAPEYPVLYAALVTRPAGVLVLRGQTMPFGQYSIFVPRDGTLQRIDFYDPKTKRFGSITPYLRPDAPYRLPNFSLVSLNDSFTDFDKDRLPDAVEFVYGTDPAKADSDRDGIPDGAEVENATNPLDGFPVQTGIIGTANTPGPAVDICTGDNLAIVAELERGVSVFNIFNGMNPILVAQVDTPGKARRVVCAKGLIAVADEDAGLAIIDVSDPANARIVHQVSVGAAVAVALAHEVAYVLTASGNVFSVDTASGGILSRIALAGEGSGVTTKFDLFVAGERLYILTSAGLRILAITEDGLQSLGAEPPPRSNVQFGRLFIAGDIAYATRALGFDTFDVKNPAQPKALGIGASTQVGWRQIVPNGSGLGLAAVGPNSGDDAAVDLQLYDIRNPASNDVFVTSFPTPGAAQAVSIFNGLAYVADAASGLQVVNYQAYDSGGVPPGVSLSANFPLNVAQVAENWHARVTALATDDVQVRNVELYVDGVLIESDGNFPFEFRFLTPRMQNGKTSFRLRAKATDTGGNFTWTDELAVALSPDITPPKLIYITPRIAGVVVDQVNAVFNEEVDPSSLATSAIRLFDAGVDGKLGTPDDVPVAGGNVSARNGRTVTLTLSTALPLGLYRAVLGQNIADLRGNHLAAEVTNDFRVVDAVYWVNPGGGDWSDPQNWSTGKLPGPADDVLISTPTAVTILHSRGNDSIKSLLLGSPLILFGGRLEVAETMQVEDLFQVAGGTLSRATLLTGQSENAFLHVMGFGHFENVTLNSELTLEDDTTLYVANGMTLNAVLTLASKGNTTALRFDGGSQILSGTGEVVFSGGRAANYLHPISGDLTIAQGITLRGGVGLIGNPTWKLVNEGTIRADADAANFRVQGGPFTNRGLVEARPGTVVSLEGNWSNEGTLRETDATLDLKGLFTTAALGKIERTGGVVKISGKLDNSGATLALNAKTGSWVLEGGVIRGGTLTMTDGASLQILRSGTFDGVTLNSDLTLEDNTTLSLANGLKLNAVVTLASKGNTTALRFDGGSQILNGTGEVVFSGGRAANYLYPISGNLTITQGITIRGGVGVIGDSNWKLVNEGTIRADANAANFRVRGGPLINRGLVEARPGTTVSLEGNWNNEGILRESEATLSLQGNFTTAGLGKIERSGGAVKIQGTLDNTAAKFALSAGTGSWLLETGIIRGGTVTTGDGATLQIMRYGTFDGVTLNSDLTVENNTTLYVANGLTLNAVVTLASAGNSTSLRFEKGEQTLGGTGEVVLGGSGQANYVYSSGGSLTLGPDITIRGGAGTVGDGNSPLTNQGTIIAEVAAKTIHVTGKPFTNQGTLRELNGGKIVINP